MSGGVDSSVAALLLKKRKYDVVGITLRFWQCTNNESFKKCCSVSDMEDAKKVASKIGIPHYVMDIRNEFKSKVINPFIKEYLSGRTPNPCVVCNEKIKFSLLFEKLKPLGIGCLATGHYAKIIKTKNGYVIKKTTDEKNDQSYWLYSINHKYLPLILFPLDKLSKEKVREIARRNNLPNANKPKSQEICFITDNDYRSFIRKFVRIKSKSGKIINSSGELSGTHNGCFNYSVGQRHGLGSIGGRKMYVIKIDPKRNLIVAGTEQETYGKKMIVEKLKINPVVSFPKKLYVKIRNQHTPALAEIKFIRRDGHSSSKAEITFEEPQRSITPGQSAVFYNGNIVLGGGIISN